MINILRIRNFVLIDELEIDFSSGLNIIIGETGSGKSMLADSLILLFGGRASAEYVRDGKNKAILEVELNYEKIPQITQILIDNSIELNQYYTLIIRREINSKGISRIFLNDSPVNLAILKSIGDLIIDFHGQHDHQSLLNSSKHIEIFDSIFHNEGMIVKYQRLRKELFDLIDEFINLQSRENDLKSKRDIITHQLKEILTFDPKSDEDLLLEKELNVVENAEKIILQCNECYELLFNSEQSAQSTLTKVSKILDNLSKFDIQFKQFSEEIQSAEIIVKETSAFLNEYLDTIDYNAEKIDQIRNRLSGINNLKRKYGAISEIIALKQKITTELDESENFEFLLKEKAQQIVDLKNEIRNVAIKISDYRKSNKGKFEKLITEKLQLMGIQNAVINISTNRVQADSNDLYSIAYEGVPLRLLEYGIEELEFHISTNIGEKPTPLANIASGGEVSRIMLAIKSILAENDVIPILVFDEIDTGISGRIARKVGIVMKELAKYHQIIAITHLPQIAALADRLILVKKYESKIRTWVESKMLNDNEKINEIAKMLSGESVSDAALESAKVLIISKV